MINMHIRLFVKTLKMYIDLLFLSEDEFSRRVKKLTRKSSKCLKLGLEAIQDYNRFTGI